MNKAMIGGILAVIAVILLVTSLAMPWYTINSEYEGEESTSRDSLHLFSPNSDSESETSNTTTTFNITSWMATIGTIASAASLMFIGMAIPANKNKFKKIGMVLLIIGIIFALIAPLYLMTSLPGAYKDDHYGENRELPDHDSPAKSFFGSHSPEGTENKYSWGGGIGWYMSIIGAVILIISLILVTISGRGAARSQPDRYGQSGPRQPTQRQSTQQPRQPSTQQQQGHGQQKPPRPQKPPQQQGSQKQSQSEEGYHEESYDKKKNWDRKDSY